MGNADNADDSTPIAEPLGVPPFTQCELLIGPDVIFDYQENDMDLNGLREALRQQPFEPFAIRLADGGSLPVRHPEFVAVGQRRAVVIGDDDSWSWIEPLLIVSLDSLPAAKKGQNGKGRKSK